MSEDAAPIDVCPECGALLEELGQRFAELENDIELLEADLKTKRAAISRMRGSQDEKVRNGPQADAADEVLEYWRERCMPRAKGLNGKRLENVAARLKDGYTVAELQRAVDGYAARPYVSSAGRSAEGSPTSKHVDAELIFRTPTHVDRGMAIAEEEGGAVWDGATDAADFEPEESKTVLAPSTEQIARDVDRGEIVASLIQKYGDVGLRTRRGAEVIESYWPCPACTGGDSDGEYPLVVRYGRGSGPLVECEACGRKADSLQDLTGTVA